ncbi:hypothetical protein C4578_01650 [Candidatus Microgenomates bacterium]|jgi:hypothetical protein|nr:MAG: hypothetical protein C4578_01650 [Candidatus Microgenomates bacterium]
MKKEVILAIIIGFGIGLVATFGLYTARNTIGRSYQIYSPVPEGDGKTVSVPTNLSLSLSSPIDESISNQSKISVSGSASPDTWIMVITEKEEKLVKSDNIGKFEMEIGLISGENEIEVTAISDSGDTLKKVVTVVYSTVEI